MDASKPWRPGKDPKLPPALARACRACAGRLGNTPDHSWKRYLGPQLHDHTVIPLALARMDRNGLGAEVGAPFALLTTHSAPFSSTLWPCSSLHELIDHVLTLSEPWKLMADATHPTHKLCTMKTAVLLL